MSKKACMAGKILASSCFAALLRKAERCRGAQGRLWLVPDPPESQNARHFLCRIAAPRLCFKWPSIS